MGCPCLPGLTVAAMTTLLGCEPPQATPSPSAVALVVRSASVAVAPRTPVIPTYPCTQCHKGPTGGKERRAPNLTQRALTEIHTRIELVHMDAPRWCHTCHDPDDPDRLRLAGGRPVAFDDVHLLCGSCHGEKLADWERNIHGLTTGYWNGPQTRRTCTGCHDPHRVSDPATGWAFVMMEPLPPVRLRDPSGRSSAAVQP